MVKIDLDKKKEVAPVEPESPEEPKAEPKAEPEAEPEKEPEVPAEPEAEAAPPEVEPETSKEETRDVIEAKADALKGLTVLGKIELPKEKPVASSDDKPERKKKKDRGGDLLPQHLKNLIKGGVVTKDQKLRKKMYPKKRYKNKSKQL